LTCLLTGPEAEERVLPDAVAVEPLEVDATAAAHELRSEARVEPDPSSATDVVL
jgi:hypothetical protein